MTKIYKLVQENKICSLPWAAAEINFQHNNIKPCCKYSEKLGDVSDGLFNVWVGPKSQQLRKDILHNFNSTGCRACDVVDGEFSYKNWKNSLWQKEFDFFYQLDTDNVELPRIFNISLNNTCNLACRMCNPGHSSKISDMVRKNNNLKQFYFLPISTKDINLESLRGSFANTEMVTFSGGEPTINNDCLEVIKMIEYESKNLRVINMSTNMMRINHEMMSKLNNMNKNVVLSVSIDGPPSIQEYIRHMSNWDTILENLILIKDLYPNIKFAVNSTISILNVGYVTETLDLIHEIHHKHDIVWQGFMTSPVLDKKFLHPALLPPSIKKLYKQKILEYQSKIFIKYSETYLPTAMSMLDDQIDESLDRFINYTRIFDKQVGTNIIKIYPEFADFIS